MFYYFLVELLTQFHDHGLQIGKLQGGGGAESALPGCTRFGKTRPV